MNCQIVHERVCHSLWHLRLQFSSPLYHTYPFCQTPTLLARNKSIIDGKTSEHPSVPKILVVQPRLRPSNVLQAKLSEALSLANSLDDQQDGYFSSSLKPSPSHVVVQNPLHFWSKARAATYFGKGTVETIGGHLTALQSEDNVDAVFVNATLTGTQLRNLEKAWDMPVLDRVGLIIEIFHAHAYTKEAKLQAELAALMYKRTRLVRERIQGGRGTFGARGESGAEVVSARGRGSGGRGFISGAGETELELQRRRIMERKNYLIAEIEEVRRTRALQRSSRRRPVGADGEVLATVSVVGYTNAGKSTLVSALSDSDLYIDDRLFATVDPKLRGVTLPSGRNVLLSDTVGFISDLPLQLVEAFHATLEEVVEADLLVHVVDSSSTNVEEQRSAVLHVLQQIGVAEKKIHDMIEVWNKIDLHEELVDSSDHLDDGLVEEGEEEVNMESEHPYDGIEMEERQSEEEEDDEEGEVRRHNFSSVVDYKHRQNESSCNEFRCERVKTSALMGLGLRDLLQVIDLKLEKLQDNIIVERGEFNRKWRPLPRYEDA